MTLLFLKEEIRNLRLEQSLLKRKLANINKEMPKAMQDRILQDYVDISKSIQEKEKEIIKLEMT